ncbi:MAG: hypothetical protein PUD39_09175 [Bacteroidales bacterium]|nr:hypothetical protein [Bacteroidales bacterium]
MDNFNNSVNQGPDKEMELTAEQGKELKRQKRKRLIIIVAAVAILLAIVGVVFAMMSSKNKELEAARQLAEETQQQLLAQQMQINELELLKIDDDFQQMEGQSVLLANDSIVEKYQAARAQIEKLRAELNNEKTKSAAQIKKLTDEINTLKGILRDYTARINELMAENDQLKEENTTIKNKNQQLNSQVQDMTRKNEHLTERMTLAEKLNVTGLTLRALNKKGKNEKNITKATRLCVTFTIPQNNSTPAGEKIIYLRITTPEGDLLSGGGSFGFEGATLQATARRSIEYANEEIGGVEIYWDVTSTLNPGPYTVELFCDNFRLASRQFEMKK